MESQVTKGEMKDLVSEQAAAGLALPGGHELILVLDALIHVIVELAQRFNVGHLFSLQPETVALFDDHNDIDKIQAVDTDLFPGSFRLDQVFFDLKFFDQKTVDFSYNVVLFHERIFRFRSINKITNKLIIGMQKKVWQKLEDEVRR
jgi:hypothetical protein